MIDVYAIGITLKLTDLVGPELLKLSAQFEKLDLLALDLAKSMKAIGAESIGMKSMATATGALDRNLARANAQAVALERNMIRVKEVGVLPGMAPGIPGGRGGSGGKGGDGHGTANYHAGLLLSIGVPLVYAIDKAAELQKQMIAVQIATHGSVKEMDAMRGVIEDISAKTVFSNVDVAKMSKLIATGTGLGASQVSSLVPAYAKFADVQLLMKGTGYEESVKDAIRLAHTAQHYDASSLEKYLDLLTKASLIVPGGLSEVGQALKYSQGIGKTALGIDDETMVLLTSMLNRMGFAGSRGGTNLVASMARTIPGIFGSGLLKGKSNEALRAMDMVDASGHSKFFENGKFSAMKWMEGISSYVQKEFASHPEAIARQDILTNFQHAFGVQGGRVASLLSNPNALEQFQLIAQSFSQAGGAADAQKTFADQSAAQQWMNAKTNFISAMTEFGTTLLPAASVALKAVNVALGNTIKLIRENQTLFKWIGYAFGVLASGLALRAGYLLLTTALRGLGAALLFPSAVTTGKLAMNLVSIGSAFGLIASLGTAALASFLALKAAKALGLPDVDAAQGRKDLAKGNWWAASTHMPAAEFIRHLWDSGRMDMKKNNPNYIATKSADGGVVYTTVNIDGKKVANAITPYIAGKLGSGMYSGGIDQSLGLQMPGLK